MNAIELLKADHDEVGAFFKEVKAHEGADHTAIFKKIKAALDVHTHIEETIFYPKLKSEGDEDLVKIVLEGLEEHGQCKMFLMELAAMTNDDEKFDPKLKVLMEDVEHHVKEEEGEMFPLVKEQFDADILKQLGAEMEAEKKNFTSERRSQAAG